MAPGGGFVVGGAGGQATVEDADEAVGQGSQGGVVRGFSCAVVVVVGPCSGRAGQCRDGLLVQGIGQPPVTGVAGQDHAFEAGCSGDR